MDAPAEQQNQDPELADKEFLRERAEVAMQAAAGLMAADRLPEARAFVALAAKIDIEVVRNVALEGGDLPLRILAADEIALHSARGQEIGRPCAVLGRAGIELAPDKEALIRAIFDRQQEGFERSELPLPRYCGMYGGDADGAIDAASPPRVFLMMARHFSANPAFMESDVPFHFLNSAANAGLPAHLFDAGVLLYDQPLKPNFSEALIAVTRDSAQQELARFRPDVLLFDGNFLPTGRTIDPAWLQAVREEHGCRIVAVLPDCYDAAGDFYGAWSDVSDAVVVFNREATHPLLSGQGDKAFPACGLPFDETLFAASEDDKEHDLVFVGRNSRGRGDLLSALYSYNIPVVGKLHSNASDLLAKNAPSMKEYADFFRKSRVTFNTGRVIGSSSFSVLTGRCFEAMLSRTVLLEEVGSHLDEYFVPFVHYVPFANCAQLVMFSQFLRKNGDYRRRIADQALPWYQRHYGSRRFWGALLNRLGLSRSMRS